MRTYLSASLSALFLASATSLAAAASLTGAPFVIDPEVSGQRVSASAFANGGGFAVSLAQDSDGDQSPDRLFFKTFTASGKQDLKKSLAAKAAPGPFGPATIFGTGGLELDGGKALVAYVDFRLSKDFTANGGLFGQVMDGRKPSGKELTLDDATKDSTQVGYVVPMADKRGLAVWSTTDAKQKMESYGRYVGRDAKIGPVDFDFTRKNSILTGVSPLGAGVVAAQRQFNKNFSKVDIFGQVYDAKGKKVGKEGVIAKDARADETLTLTLAGLDGEKIIVLNAVAKGGSATLTGQLYDKSWKKVGAEKTLMKGLADEVYTFTPLTGGDFLVAAVVGKGSSARIEFRRFGQNLKQLGETAKSRTDSGLMVNQLLELENRDVVAIYETKDLQAKGQIVKP